MIKNILKGFIIGIAKIMPGVSGSMLAICLNVYETLLDIIANFRKMDLSKFKFLMSILVGVAFSISLFSRTVMWLLEIFYFPVMMLFIGLILGGMPEIFGEIKGEKYKIKNILIFSFALLFSYLLTLVGSFNAINNENEFVYFCLGLLEAFSSIVPGISGTAIYMSLGVYDMILDFFSNIFNPFYFKFAVFFGLGILVGVILLAKFITYLLKNKKSEYSHAFILNKSYLKNYC